MRLLQSLFLFAAIYSPVVLADAFHFSVLMHVLQDSSKQLRPVIPHSSSLMVCVQLVSPAPTGYTASALRY